MKRRSTTLLALGAVLALPAAADEDKKEILSVPSLAKGPDLSAPAEFTNSTPTPSEYKLPVTSRFEVTKRIHDLVTKEGGPSAEAEMKNYEDAVERSNNAKLKMVAIKGGKVLLGSPDTEKDRESHEGPQVEVQIEPFWIGETEITWALYQSFYQNGVARHKDGVLIGEGEELKVTVKGKEKEKAAAQAADLAKGDKDNIIDVVTQPTPQYHDMFLSGDFANTPEYPAMTMTHHAASKFCKWLTAQTGHFYRLPTEAEWEYACRAGATTAYAWGDDADKMDDYAWFVDNADYTYQPVGKKKPNAWGLYDMHGNVAEWVLDGFSEDYRSTLKTGTLNPWNISVTRYPRIVKGGSWDHDPEDLRVAARDTSINKWKDWDPQVPKSIWYHTDSQHVGFRVVRPLKTPTAEEMHLYWNTDWWEPTRNGEDL